MNIQPYNMPHKRTEATSRQQYLGASEAACILGLSRYATPFDIWHHKTFGRESTDTAATKRGKYLEQGLLAWGADEVQATAVMGGIPIDQPGIEGPKPWMAFHPDGFVMVDGAWQLVEAKTSRNTHEWGEDDDIPQEYLVQVQYQLACTGGQSAYVFAYLPIADKLKVYTVNRDDQFIAVMLEILDGWWNRHVVANVAPELDGGDTVRPYLLAKFPRETQPLRDLQDGESDLIAEFLQARALAAETEDKLDVLKARVQAAIGDAEGIKVNGGKVTWKWQHGSKRLDAKALEADMPHIAERYRKQGEPTRVLRVAVK